MGRNAAVTRVTKETDIRMNLELDGSGKSSIDTGIGFFDHMLEGFAKHGFFDLEVAIKGDLHVDGHHTVEDAGIVLGTAIREAAGVCLQIEAKCCNVSVSWAWYPDEMTWSESVYDWRKYWSAPAIHSLIAYISSSECSSFTIVVRNS